MNRGRLALKIAIPFTLVAAIVIGFATPALAEKRGGADIKPSSVVSNVVQGKVVGIPTGSSFTLQNASGNVTVSTNATTAYWVVEAGRPLVAAGKKASRVDKETLKNWSNDLKKLDIPSDLRGAAGRLERFLRKGAFSDIALGDRVIARVNNGVATRVLVLKIATPGPQPAKGTIAAVTSSNITINTANGPVTVNWDATTRFVLKGLIAVAPGQYATAAYNKNTKLAQVIEVQASAPTH